MKITKEKIKYWVETNHWTFNLTMFIAFLIVAGITFLIIWILANGISEITGLEYNEEALPSAISSFLFLNIVWIAILQSTKNPNSGFYLKDNIKKGRFLINLFYLISVFIIFFLLFFV